MAAPITSEASQYPHTTFLEPAICRPRRGAPPPPPHPNPRPIWYHEDPQEHIKVPSVDPTLFGSDSFSSRSYSNSFMRSSADHHSSHHCLPPPLTEPPSPRPYFEFGLTPAYPEPPQYHLSDAALTPTREADPQISPVSPESPWDRQCIEVPSPHGGQHDPSPTPRTAIAPWLNVNSDGTARPRQPTYTARMRTSQACQKCRSRKAKCDGKSPCERCTTRGLTCEYARERRMRGPNKKPGKNRHQEEDSFYALG